MTVRQLIRRLTELDRDDAVVGVMLFEKTGVVTVAAAHDAKFIDNRQSQAASPSTESDYQAVLIVAGQEQPQSERGIDGTGRKPVIS